jgi:16S rRNA (cytosine967-C5)-methyltransferase
LSLTQALEARRADAGQDARLIPAAQDLAYGTLRQYGRLAYYLDQLLAQPPFPAELRGLLLVALHELNSGETPDYAAVNEAVALAARLMPRAKGLVNGVLRNFLRRRMELDAGVEANPQARWNFPDWWLARLKKQYPEAWSAIVDSLNGHPPMTLRVNRRRSDVIGYLGLLGQARITAKQTGEYALTLDQPMPTRNLPGFAEGFVSVQDLGAQLAADLLQAEDGMHVLDACAAPGGKTTHLLEAHDIDLVALDRDAHRL